MTLHTHITQPISLQHIKFIHHAGFSDTAQTRFERSRSLKQGQRSGSQHTLSFARYGQDKILNGKATTRSNHGHTMILKVTTARSNQVHITHYSFQDTDRTRLLPTCLPAQFQGNYAANISYVARAQTPKFLSGYIKHKIQFQQYNFY